MSDWSFESWLLMIQNIRDGIQILAFSCCFCLCAPSHTRYKPVPKGHSVQFVSLLKRQTQVALEFALRIIHPQIVALSFEQIPFHLVLSLSAVWAACPVGSSTYTSFVWVTQWQLGCAPFWRKPSAFLPFGSQQLHPGQLTITRSVPKALFGAFLVTIHGLDI